MTDFIPRRDVQAISHINVVVDDIEVATEFYRTVLGFEQAANADGPMDYPGVDLASFARDAGFDDGRVSLDVRFLKHPEVGVYLELFTYHHPKGDQTIHRRKTNDLGGIRHVAVEVPDAVAAHAFIRFQQQAYGKRGLHIEIVGQECSRRFRARVSSSTARPRLASESVSQIIHRVGYTWFALLAGNYPVTVVLDFDQLFPPRWQLLS